MERVHSLDAARPRARRGSHRWRSTGQALAQTPLPPPEVLDPDLAVRPDRLGARRSRSRWPSSAATTSWCSRRRPARSSGCVNGAVQGTVLDLAVNFDSERGLLGIALHPNSRATAGVYLFWSREQRPAPTRTGRRRRAAARQPRRPVRVGRDGARRSTATSSSSGPSSRTPARPPARQPQRRRHPLRAGRQAVRHRRRQRPARPDAEPARTGPFGPGSPGRPVRRPGARRRPPDRRDPAAQRRRRRARATTRSSRAGAQRWAARSARTSRRSSPTASATASAWRSTRSGRPVGAGERRRLVQRAQPGRARA